MTLRNLPIKRKLIVAMLVTTGVVLFLTSAAFITYELVVFRKEMVRNVRTLAEVIAANSTASLAFRNEQDAKETLLALKAEPQIVAACLYDRTGNLFVTYPHLIPGNMFPASPAKDGYRFEKGHLLVFQPVVQSNHRQGTLFLKTDLAAMYHRFQLYLGLVILVLAVSLLVAFIVSNFLQKGISGPILALADTARAVSEKNDYSVRASKQGGDELGALTDGFNQMLDQIHEQNNALREKEERLTKMNAELEQRVSERTAELEGANKELEAFSYSVSHDLRAPVRHIGGFVDLLGKSCADKLDDKGRRYVNMIASSAKQMGQLIDDLLIFSRMGREEIQKTIVDTNQLVESTIASLQRETEGRNIIWKKNALPKLRADPAMLRQVFVNLISNAIKYSQPRNPAQIEIGAKENAKELVIFVRDNGVGFDMQFADKLFGVFQRLHRSDEFEGTGIGLANVRRIIQRHGGHTWAEAIVDHGATFYFSLPKSK
jgi:signal transduction histidine kinase